MRNEVSKNTYIYLCLVLILDNINFYIVFLICVYEQNVCKSSQFNAVRQKAAQLEKDLEKANRIFEQKSLSIASHEIWRTCVEIKALDNKLSVLSKTKPNGLI